MKRLTCEMCGSTDIVKQDGLFVCQNCGTKYSVEEARKMMIEGTVDVSGSTVNIDNSDKISNLYQVARRFRDDNNAPNAEKYYQMILVDDPTSWEASFYVIYFNAMQCRIAGITAAANSVSNCLKNVFSLIQSHCPVEAQNSAVEEIVARCISISGFLSSGALQHVRSIDNYDTPHVRTEIKKDFIQQIIASRNIMYECGDEIDYIFGNKNVEIAKYAISAWKTGVAYHKAIIETKKSLYTVSPEEESKDLEVINSYIKKYGKYDNSEKLKAEIRAIDDKIENIQKSETRAPKWTLIAAFVYFILAIFTWFMSPTIGKIFGGMCIFCLISAPFVYSKHNNNEEQISQLNIERKKKWQELNSQSKEDKQIPEPLPINSQQKQVQGQVNYQQIKGPQQVVNQQSQTPNSIMGGTAFQPNQIPNNIPSLMNTVDNMNSAKEIYDYLLEFSKYYPNVFNSTVMEDLNKSVYIEKMYGNHKHDAIKILRRYFHLPN